MELPADFSALAAARYVSLTTFRRTGERVSTPVWIAPDARNGATLYVLTMAGAGKLKRIRNNTAIELAPCDFRGRVLGPTVPATARILSPSDHAIADHALTRKYGLQKRALDLYHFLWKGQRAYLAIEFSGAHARPGACRPNGYRQPASPSPGHRQLLTIRYSSGVAHL